VGSLIPIIHLTSHLLILAPYLSVPPISLSSLPSQSIISTLLTHIVSRAISLSLDYGQYTLTPFISMSHSTSLLPHFSHPPISRLSLSSQPIIFLNSSHVTAAELAEQTFTAATITLIFAPDSESSRTPPDTMAYNWYRNRPQNTMPVSTVTVLHGLKSVKIRHGNRIGVN